MGNRREADYVSGRDMNYMGYSNNVLDEFILSVLSYPEQMRKRNVLDDPTAWWSNSWNDRHLSVQRRFNVLFLTLDVPSIVGTGIAHDAAQEFPPS